MNEFEIKNGWLRVWGQYEERHADLKNLTGYRYEEVQDRSWLVVSGGGSVIDFNLPLETGRKLLEQLYVAVRQADCC